jgi:hypothetical protein
LAEIKNTCWKTVDGRDILIISDSWKGSPIIACKADLILISEYVYEKYKDKFISGAENSRFIFY